jgi:hypothetical protein
MGIQASSLIVTIFLARLLEPSYFGMVIVSIATIFSDIGLEGEGIYATLAFLSFSLPLIQDMPVLLLL